LNKPAFGRRLPFSAYSGSVVINQYITVALRRAHYELLENDEGFYGSIPELVGVWARAATLEECREELKEALEDWLLFSLSRQQPIPAMDGIDLVIREVA
jgi:predicted RNase H-like HicB family nuclease